jgi:hypothetical protein
MERESFKKILTDRLNHELYLKKIYQEKYSASILSKCNKIIDELREDLPNVIRDYNEAFDEMKLENEIKLFYDTYFSEKNSYSRNHEILLIFRNKNSIRPEGNYHNFNRCLISLQKKRGVENQYFFLVNTFIFTDDFSQLIDEKFELNYDELNESFIKDELMKLIYQSVEIYLKKGDFKH